jgi:ketosteroid isomerase-like protein
MTEVHPNVARIAQFDPHDPTGAAGLFTEDVVWHYVNPKLPEVEGDYVGPAGIRRFFAAITSKSTGSFRVNPVSATAMGDELVVVHSRNSMTIEGRAITIDAVVVWRFVEGRVTEVWDIPSIHTLARVE